MITAVTGPDRNRRLAGVLVGGLGAVAIIAALAGGWGGGAPHLSPKGLWFLACVALVLIAKQLRKVLMRPEDYYDR